MPFLLLLIGDLVGGRMTSSRIVFNRLTNTRDLGGMRTMDGHSIKKGMLLRSAQLYHADDPDKEKLSSMVDIVLDFRNDLEAEEKPDPLIPGVKYLHLPILEKLAPGISRDKNSSEDIIKDMAFEPEHALVYMMNLYAQFATSRFAMSQYSKFIDILLQEREGAVLWHCSAGKDRAGFGAVIVERLLGVDENSVVADYLLTNEYLKDEVNSIIAVAEKQLGCESDALRKSMGYLFGARIEYITSLDAKIAERYGSFDTYAREGLGVDEEKLTRLREKYLE